MHVYFIWAYHLEGGIVGSSKEEEPVGGRVCVMQTSGILIF